MNAATWTWRLLGTAGVLLALGGAPAWADDKGKGDGKVIVIQLDASKASPALLKQLMELAQGGGKGDTKPSAKTDDDKKGDGKQPSGAKKANVVQVDLNQLPPDLAKRLTAELAKGKKGGQDDDKKDDDKKKKGDKDDDDDDKAKKSKKKDD